MLHTPAPTHPPPRALPCLHPASLRIPTSRFLQFYSSVCVREGQGLGGAEEGGAQAGCHAPSQCHKLLLDAGLRLPCVFGQEGNVIGFVQSSWQPAPADICSLLTTQTYLHQGTHTHACARTLSHPADKCTRRFTRSHTRATAVLLLARKERRGKKKKKKRGDDLAACLRANFAIMESLVHQ